MIAKIRVTSEPSIKFQKCTVEITREISFADSEALTKSIKKYQGIASARALEECRRLVEEAKER